MHVARDLTRDEVDLVLKLEAGSISTPIVQPSSPRTSARA
jgi:hypothetical protein